MAETWTLTFWDERSGRQGKRVFNDETHFLNAVREKLRDHWASNIAATIPNGRTLDQSQLEVLVGQSR